MRKIRFSTKLKWLAVTILLSIGTMLAWAITKVMPSTANRKPVIEETQQTPEKDRTYDPALLEQFAEVSAKLSGKQEEYLVSGSISSKDGADKLAQTQRLAYIFSKKGNDFYYKLGETETINSNGLYLHINHIAHKVLLSPQKQAVNQPGMPDLSYLLESLDSEGYELKEQTTGNIRTISFLNNYHNSCKEYALSFDKESLLPGRIYMRLNKTANFEGAETEQDVEMKIDELKDNSEIEKYIIKQVVTREGNNWRLTNRYTGYTLVVM